MAGIVINGYKETYVYPLLMSAMVVPIPMLMEL